MVATKLVPVETSSRLSPVLLLVVTTLVTLSHKECLPQALALDPVGPLDALDVSLN